MQHGSSSEFSWVDVCSVLLVTTLWGLSFSATKLGLQWFDPFLLAACRFFFSGFPAVFVVPRPRLPLRFVLGYALAIGVGQFGLMFWSIQLGLSAGLASLILQLQAFFTLGFGALLLSERIVLRQWLGISLAFVGVWGIARITDGSVTLIGLLLGVAAAASWGVGNLIAKRTKAPPRELFRMVVWAGLVASAPLLLLSLLWEGWDGLLRQIGGGLHWEALGVVAYLSLLANLVGYGLWNRLLSRLPASKVAPWSLLAPISGLLSSWWLFGESISAEKLTAMGLVLAGLCINQVNPLHWLRPPARPAAAGQTSGRGH